MQDPILPRETNKFRRYLLNPEKDIKLVELAEIIATMGLKMSEEILQSMSPGAQRHFIPLAPIVAAPKVIQPPKILMPKAK